MADERYQWLDQEAAERLLRGEPVDALDDPARSEVRRLAEALESARKHATVPGPRAARAGGVELPGEAAALAAFRRATAERAARAAAAAPHGTLRTDHRDRTDLAELGRVRLAPVTAPARRWGRSVRYGLAAAVAAVTVGGVAVAAGTGVLPLVGPEPASSVTAVESPDPIVSGSVQKDPLSPSPAPDDTDRPPGSSPSPGVSSSPSSPVSPSLTSPPTGRHTPEPGRTTPTPGGSKSVDGGTALKEKAVNACRDYRSGRLDEAGRRQLTSNLRSGETLRRYCDRILSGGTGGTGGSGGSGGSGASADPREDGKDDGKGDGAGSRDDSRDGSPSDNHGGNGGVDDGTADGANERRNRASGDPDEIRRAAFSFQV
ncbi:hypothetical protein ACFXGT_05105 [Streptomyces sp. NPDC059352]|uniref:hypothetical protein n=1 Tax=Streptomyces sp. NPDC059352 TaxID=3346810 RepID=UPI003695EDB2